MSIDPVMRAVDQLATPGKKRLPGKGYSPAALVLVRWLHYRPGSTLSLLARAHEDHVVSARMATLVRLGLVEDRGYVLTDSGERFRQMIDDEGIV